MAATRPENNEVKRTSPENASQEMKATPETTWEKILTLQQMRNTFGVTLLKIDECEKFAAELAISIVDLPRQFQNDEKKALVLLNEAKIHLASLQENLNDYIKRCFTQDFKEDEDVGATVSLHFLEKTDVLATKIRPINKKIELMKQAINEKKSAIAEIKANPLRNCNKQIFHAISLLHGIENSLNSTIYSMALQANSLFEINSNLQAAAAYRVTYRSDHSIINKLEILEIKLREAKEITPEQLKASMLELTSIVKKHQDSLKEFCKDIYKLHEEAVSQQLRENTKLAQQRLFSPNPAPSNPSYAGNSKPGVFTLLRNP